MLWACSGTVNVSVWRPATAAESFVEIVVGSDTRN